ncbi:MAG TPA: hypothetical protein VFG91_01940 [Woeseiaceae bacterium]|nr:hypothetical protein [Woeseiaceae bacterium]
MCEYHIEFVGDDELPTGIDWMFIERARDALWLFVRESALPSPHLWMAAWAAYREMAKPAWEINLPIAV